MIRVGASRRVGPSQTLCPPAVSLAALLSLSMACGPRSLDCSQVRVVTITATVGNVP